MSWIEWQTENRRAWCTLPDRPSYEQEDLPQCDDCKAYTHPLDLNVCPHCYYLLCPLCDDPDIHCPEECGKIGRAHV